MDGKAFCDLCCPFLLSTSTDYSLPSWGTFCIKDMDPCAEMDPSAEMNRAGIEPVQKWTSELKRTVLKQTLVLKWTLLKWTLQD